MTGDFILVFMALRIEQVEGAVVVAIFSFSCRRRTRNDDDGTTVAIVMFVIPHIYGIQ